MARLPTHSRPLGSRGGILLLLLAVPLLSQAFIPSIFKPAVTSAPSRWVAGGNKDPSSSALAVSAKPRARESKVVMMSAKGTSNNQMSQESYTEKAWEVIMRLPQLATRCVYCYSA